MKKGLLFLVPLMLLGCVKMPKGVQPVTDFDVERYLGTWYEIARLDHRFERGLENVTAHYSAREDGGIKVVNRGFDPEANEWKEVVGKAYFVDDPQTGRLKVSFWDPFYSAYNIIDLDRENYEWSLVCGPNKSYLWILARQPDMDASLKSDLIQKAAAYGFATEELIFVQH